MTNTENTPKEVDTQLAAKYNDMYRLWDRLDMFKSSAQSQAGAKFYYQGKQRVTDMKVEEAEAILAADIEANRAGEGSFEDNPNCDFGYVTVRGGHNIGSIRRTVEGLSETRKALAQVELEIAELEELYTGWSRFFLVTSSKGHIHNSTHCHTCRVTTRYGWLPELSGQTEAEAVDAHGPALCSVCYPTAPLDWQGGWITKAQAEKRAA